MRERKKKKGGQKEMKKDGKHLEHRGNKQRERRKKEMEGNFDI